MLVGLGSLEARVSDTPRTDFAISDLSRPFIEFARELERELASSEQIRHAEKKILLDEITAHTRTKLKLDVFLYERASERMRAAFTLHRDDEVQRAWEELEQIKNRHGGMPPQPEEKEQA